MKASQSALDFLGQAVKLPFQFFADDDERVLERLDELHKQLPNSLPEKRFFKH